MRKQLLITINLYTKFEVPCFTLPKIGL